MAARTRGTRSGGMLVLLGLTAFIVVAAGVVFRRSEGTRIAREMRRMNTERRDLLTRQVTLRTRLRGATRRAAVVREAERRLGLHVATEAQTRSLPGTTAR